MALNNLEEPHSDLLVLTRSKTHVPEPSAADRLTSDAYTHLFRHNHEHAERIFGLFGPEESFLLRFEHPRINERYSTVISPKGNVKGTIKGTPKFSMYFLPDYLYEYGSNSNGRYVIEYTPPTPVNNDVYPKWVFPFDPDGLDEGIVTFAEAFVEFYSHAAVAHMHALKQYLSDFAPNIATAHKEVAYNILQRYPSQILTRLSKLQKNLDLSDTDDVFGGENTRVHDHFLYVDQQKGVHLVSFAQTPGTQTFTPIISSTDREQIITNLEVNDVFTFKDGQSTSYGFKCRDSRNPSNIGAAVVTVRPVYIAKENGEDVYCDDGLLTGLLILQDLKYPFKLDEIIHQP